MFLFFSALAIENEIRSSRKVPYISDELIVKIAQGDQDAFHKLYEETSSLVFGYALSILKDKHKAEDVMQDTYIKVYSNAGSYTGKGKPMAWILTITRNLALMNFRQKQHENIDDDQYQSIYDMPHIHSENKMLVDHLLSRLSDEEREIVMLHAMSELKHREIAALMELPLSTVLSKYNRAIAKLREFMKEER
ncbi:MAG: RNA polymerase sigma factor [Clostridia bacterium]|nr:RNA polymerase sigma factor [Clostridia bacterium]